MIKVALIVMVLIAIASIQSKSVRMAVIYLSILSLASSFVYVFLGAPDVAIAEAVIGVTLSTVLYLVAIKKYRVFRVYYHVNIDNPELLPKAHSSRDAIEKYMDTYLRDSEIEVELINTKEAREVIESEYDYDAIIIHDDTGIHLYGDTRNYRYEGLVAYLEENEIKGIEFVSINEEDVYET